MDLKSRSKDVGSSGLSEELSVNVEPSAVVLHVRKDCGNSVTSVLSGEPRALFVCCQVVQCDVYPICRDATDIGEADSGSP